MIDREGCLFNRFLLKESFDYIWKRMVNASAAIKGLENIIRLAEWVLNFQVSLQQNGADARARLML